MEDWGRVILSPEAASARFHDKVLVLAAGAEPVTVSRSDKEERPDTENAVFDCRVLSKPQAVLRFAEGHFLIKDVGSSNGTFINNFRLSKAGLESEETRIYSDDVLKFGSEIETDGHKSRCVVCRVKIYSRDGAECGPRAIADRLYRPKSDFIANVTVKQVKFSEGKQDNGETNALEKLEKMITEKFVAEQESLKDSITSLEKKLRRKQNENQNLIDNIEKLTKAELDRVSEIYDLKEALQIRDKECLKLSDELAVKTKEQIENVKVKDLECELEDLRKILKLTTDELWLLKEKMKVESTKTRRKHDIENNNVDEKQMVAQVTEIKKLHCVVETQKEEIEGLTELVTKGDTIIQQRDTEIQNLRRALATDQEQMTIREGEYSSLRCMMDEEHETVHQIQEEMSRLLKIIASDQEEMVAKDREIDQLKVKNDTISKDLTTMEDQLKQKTEEQGQQEAMVTMMESYKEKIKESMDIIGQKSEEIEKLQRTSAASTDPTLLNEKNNEIAQLKEQVEAKEKQIAETAAKSKHHETAITEINSQVLGFEAELRAKEDMIRCLQVEVENERRVAAHVQFTQERELMMKEKEMAALNTILTQERRLLLDKEEEVKTLRAAVEIDNKSQPPTPRRKPREAAEQPTPTRPPRQTRSLFITTNMQVDAGLILSNGNNNGHAASRENNDDNNSDTVTFHDALNDQEAGAEDAPTTVISDEEDVLIEDLELDEDADDRQPRLSDINFDQFSLC